MRLDDPSLPDEPDLGLATLELLQAHGRAWAFWFHLVEFEADWRAAQTVLEAEGLPPVLAAIPYTWSARCEDLRLCTSGGCGRGPWMLPPAFPGTNLRDCALVRGQGTWSPGQGPVPILENGRCGLGACAVDDRLSIAASTRAIAPRLQRTWLEARVRGEQSALVATVTRWSDADPAAILALDGLAECWFSRHEPRARGEEPTGLCAQVGLPSREEMVEMLEEHEPKTLARWKQRGLVAGD